MASSKMFLYFAFGSNMWSGRIRYNNKSAIAKSAALLKDYRLDFTYFSKRWQGASATIIPQQGSTMYGVLWEVDLKDMESLDKQEGVTDGIYRKLNLTVETVPHGEHVECTGYQVREEVQNKSMEQHGENLKPSKAYLDVIIKGAEENHLPEHYVQKIKQIEHNGFDGEVDLSLSLRVTSS